jgi:predicted glycosyltransferase
MYSQDGNGLGHLRRSFNIARDVRARNPRCDILIVADSPAVSIVGTTPGIDLIKLPTIVKTGSSSWETATLSVSARSLVKLRAQLMLHAFAEFRPDTVLVDHMPVGAMGELKPMLDHASTRPRPPRIFLGLRDVLDRPAVIRRTWGDLGAYDYLPVYDAVLVYGDRGVYDATAAYGLLPQARAVVYCNYIAPCRRAPAAPSALREPFVLMMGGGGADAFPLAKAFVEAIPAVERELNIGAVLLTGPNMAAGERARLAERATGIQIESRYGDATEWIRSAAAIVTMAGYNSLCEVLAWQQKALVVPRCGPSAEQQIRSSLFSKRSLIRRLEPKTLDPGRLADALIRLLVDDGVPDVARIPRLDGAQLTANVLLEWTDALAAPDPPRLNGVHHPAAAAVAAAPGMEAAAL